jgi:hypothetical protein
VRSWAIGTLAVANWRGRTAGPGLQLVCRAGVVHLDCHDASRACQEAAMMHDTMMWGMGIGQLLLLVLLVLAVAALVKYVFFR